MENSIKSLTTADSKTVVEYKSFITGRDAEALSEVTGETMEKKNLAATHATIKLIVVSVNGHKDGDEVDGAPFSCLEAIRDLPFKEYMEVADAMQEAVFGKKDGSSAPTA